MVDDKFSMQCLLEALDCSADGIYIYDDQLKLIYANDAAMKENSLDHTALGKKWGELKSSGKFYGTAALDAHLYKKTFTSEFITSTGQHLHCIATPVFNKHGNIKYIISNMKNITSFNIMRQNALKNNAQFVDKTFIYSSYKIKTIISTIEKIAKKDFPVMIYGETGVGKSDIAELIHKLSLNAELPFIAINCGAIAHTLCDAEFFGYEKGAFTGAIQRKKGIFEIANNGTLFLDEIGELPLFMQVKLLRVLQEKKIKRLGSDKEISVNFRIITATNKDIRKMIFQNEFREDLFYRLNGINIEIPPLRERKDDIKVLLAYFLEHFNIKYSTSKKFSAELCDILERYSYPGNVRELAYIVEKLVILSAGTVIEKEEFFSQGLIDEKQTEIRPLKEVLAEAEREYLVKVRAQYGSTRSMAKVLRVSHVTIAQKLKIYGIS